MYGHADEPEEPTRKFKGWWFPAEIVALYDNQEISEKELILLATIDSLVDTVAGIPCYAGNAYLAERIHVTDERTVQRMIQKLKDLNVITFLGTDGRKRYLETAWSRVPQWHRATPAERNEILSGRNGNQG